MTPHALIAKIDAALADIVSLYDRNHRTSDAVWRIKSSTILSQADWTLRECRQAIENVQADFEAAELERDELAARLDKLREPRWGIEGL